MLRVSFLFKNTYPPPDRNYISRPTRYVREAKEKEFLHTFIYKSRYASACICIYKQFSNKGIILASTRNTEHIAITYLLVPNYCHQIK